MNRIMPGLPVHHQLPESTQTHAHQISLIEDSECYPWVFLEEK